MQRSLIHRQHAQLLAYGIGVLQALHGIALIRDQHGIDFAIHEKQFLRLAQLQHDDGQHCPCRASLFDDGFDAHRDGNGADEDFQHIARLRV